MSKKNILLILVALVVLVVVAVFTFNYFSSQEDFSVNTILLKSNLPLKGESLNKIRIINNGESNSFNIRLEELEGIVTVSEKEFILSSGESKEIEIYFKDVKNEVAIYFGELIIETSSLVKKIPIVLNIEDEFHSYAILQETIPKYDNVYPGGKFGMNIRIFNLRDNRLSSLNIEHSIRNLNGELILSENEEIIVKENLGTTKIVSIPKTIPHGNYIFISSIDYNGSKSIAGHLFSITKKETIFSSINLKYFVIIIMTFIIGITFLFFYFMKTRKDLLISLKRQQNSELKRNSELIKSFEKKLKKTTKSPERKKKIEVLKEVKKKIIKTIKVKQKKQRKEFKRLKKKGKKDEIKEKMNFWKKEGYKIIGTENKMKKIAGKSISKQVEELKRKGFDTSILGS